MLNRLVVNCCFECIAFASSNLCFHMFFFSVETSKSHFDGARRHAWQGNPLCLPLLLSQLIYIAIHATRPLVYIDMYSVRVDVLGYFRKCLRAVLFYSILDTQNSKCKIFTKTFTSNCCIFSRYETGTTRNKFFFRQSES